MPALPYLYPLFFCTFLQLRTITAQQRYPYPGPALTPPPVAIRHLLLRNRYRPDGLHGVQSKARPNRNVPKECVFSFQRTSGLSSLQSKFNKNPPVSRWPRRRTLVVLAGLPTVLFDFSVFYTAGMGQKIPRWFPNEAHDCCCALTCFRSHLKQNSQSIMWFIPHNTLVIRFTYCLYLSIPFFSSINFPSKISCNTCLHGIRCNLLTSDASITRKVVW